MPSDEAFWKKNWRNWRGSLKRGCDEVLWREITLSGFLGGPKEEEVLREGKEVHCRMT